MAGGLALAAEMDGRRTRLEAEPARGTAVSRAGDTQMEPAEVPDGQVRRILPCICIGLFLAACSTAPSLEESSDGVLATDESQSPTTTEAEPESTSSLEPLDGPANSSDGSPSYRCERENGTFASSGSTRGQGEARERCVDGAWIAFPSVAATTTTSVDAERAVNNMFLMADLQSGSATDEVADFRSAMADYILGLGFERVDLISGDASERSMPIFVVEVTSRWATDENQLEDAVALVDALAKLAWTPDLLGASSSSYGPVSLRLTSDRREFFIPGDEMVRIADYRMSARTAMGL